MRLLFFLIVFITALFIYYPTFNLAFWGDDWLIFWINKYFHGPPSSGEWSYLSHFFTAYGSQVIVMEFLNTIFGSNPFYFYTSSFLLRVLAAFSIYPLVFYITKSKLSAFFSMLFFSITFTGIETSEYLPHMTSYISLFFLNLFFYFLIRANIEGERKLIVYLSAFFIPAFIFAPPRMTGLVPFVILFEIIWLIKTPRFWKKGLFILSFISLIFILINIAGHPFFPLSRPEQPIINTPPVSAIFNGLSSIQDLLKNGKFVVLVYPIIFFGNIFLPDIIIKDILVLKIWAPILTSILILVSGLYILKKFNSNNLIFMGIIISLIWPFLAYLLPWLWSPESFFPSQHRYLIPTIISSSLFLGIILSLARAKKYVLLTVAILILVHLISSQKYWLPIEKSRNQQISQKIWSEFPYYPEVGKGSQPDVFYFSGDINNSTIIHDLITFGFPPHIDLLYNLNYLKGDLIPIPMSEWKDVVSAVKDGKSMKAYSYPEEPISTNNVYSFYLNSESELIDNTREMRIKLESEKTK